MEKAYRNVGYIFFLFIPLTFLGFYKSYFVVSKDFEGSADIYTHIHAFVASIWIVLLIVQPLLIRYKYYRQHKFLGKVSIGVFIALILTFLPQMSKEFGKDLLPLNAAFDVILLILFYSLALIHKKKVAVHMRYMIAISLIFVGPTLGRMLFFLLELRALGPYHVPYLLVIAILVVLIFWDKKSGRNYKPYIVSLIAFIVYLLALFTIDTNLS